MKAKKTSFRLDPSTLAVDLQNLLPRNARAASPLVQMEANCLVCTQSANTHFLVLNNNDSVCESCLEELSQITYPEIYEKKWRRFLEEKEAWETAFERIQTHWSENVGWRLIGIGVALIVIVFPIRAVLFSGISLVVIGCCLLGRYRYGVARWQKRFTKPRVPILLHFIDENAELTVRDSRILEVFWHWPGKPPFWSELRSRILIRDQNRCQMTGCPSVLPLEVHHIQMRSNGGSHKEENLITLCEFHHATLPEDHFFILYCFSVNRTKAESF